MSNDPHICPAKGCGMRSFYFDAVERVWRCFSCGHKDKR